MREPQAGQSVEDLLEVEICPEGRVLAEAERNISLISKALMVVSLLERADSNAGRATSDITVVLVSFPPGLLESQRWISVWRTDLTTPNTLTSK